MKTIGVIPSRYASTRFPGKPLTDICGKPMIWWVYTRALKAKNLNDLIVATDNMKIYDVCKSYGFSVIMTSDKNDTSLDRIYEVSTKIEADNYVSINGDEPLLEPETIDIVCQSFFDDTSFDVVNAMAEIKNPVDVVDSTNLKIVTDKIGSCLYISRSPIPYPKGTQNFTYKKFVGVTLLKKSALDIYHLSEKSILEEAEGCDSIRFIENKVPMKFVQIPFETHSIDTPADLETIIRIINETRLGNI